MIQGDVNALGKVYDLYVDTLFSYGFQLSKDKGYTMDCIHDLFLDLYKYRGRLSEVDNIEYYLIRSIKRKINRRHKEKLVHCSKETFEAQYALLRQDLSPEEVLVAFENDAQKTNIWQKATVFLTKTQQKGIILRFKEGRPYEEIAEIMDVSVETSRTIIYRAIKSLRENMILPTMVLGKILMEFLIG
ncbi:MULTISPECIES: RNA polymerase sigma factor [Flavobacteriaceae]|uniref:RNA polymerase sigma factor n=1 Tax=Flavobacteriaceae TaxID=49546 RepID=UPI00149271EA|nr:MULTISPECIES: sigma-70 family RNA polymerase sigma factor [Allomuricauda]MDC6366788.1 sigma-70 family RNA polymerase sigma factor [Muricauda sp. AC10]